MMSLFHGRVFLLLFYSLLECVSVGVILRWPSTAKFCIHIIYPFHQIVYCIFQVVAILVVLVKIIIVISINVIRKSPSGIVVISTVIVIVSAVVVMVVFFLDFPNLFTS